MSTFALPPEVEEALAALDVETEVDTVNHVTRHAIVGVDDVRAAIRHALDDAMLGANGAGSRWPCAVDVYGGGCFSPASRRCPGCSAYTCEDHVRVWYGEHGCALCMDGPPLARVPDDGIAGGQGRTADEARTSADVVLAMAFGLVGIAVAAWAVLAAWGAW